VVLLHGQPGTGGDWGLVTRLIDDRYLLVVPDRPGYGRTGGTATGFGCNAEAVIRLLDRLDVERAVLVGHSWGGGVALAAAVRHPDRVRGLVLVSSVGPGEHHGWSDRLLATPILGEVLAAVTIGGMGLVVGRPRVQTLAAQRLAGRPQQAVTALTRLTKGGGRVWRSFVTEQRALLSELPGLTEEVGAIRAPTVIVHGRKDRFVPVSVARQLAAAIPHASLREVPRVGHLLPQDRPEIIARAIAEVATGPGDQTDR
jgi:pimeloyl-ACP methyl ester carboxylesterase